LRKLVLIIFVLLASLGKAQVVLPTAETAFEPAHNFNPTIIKERGIRKIVFEIIDKKDYEVAVDRSLTETYEFNEDGKISRFYYTVIAKAIEKRVTHLNRKGRETVSTSTEYLYDTVSTSYFYQKGQLALKRYHDGLNYYESRYYHYDTLGNVTKELRYRETNVSPDKSYFVLGNQVLLSEDSFQYKKFSSGQLKCTFLNNENRPYKERITNYDTQGRKTSVNENYTSAGWIMQEQKFEYSAERMVAARFEGNANNTVVLRNTYEYDENKELYSEKQYRNDVMERELSYVTNKADSLLNSIVIRDPINKTIRIIRLKYDRGQVSKQEN
jgi:hypothetical protein